MRKPKQRNTTMTDRQKRMLRNYWKATYHWVQIRPNGEVWAQRYRGEPFGLLETAAQAMASVKVLEQRTQR